MEEAAIKAINKVIRVLLVLIAVMLVTVFIAMYHAFSLLGSEGVRRMGTVEKGFLRYTLNGEYYYISLEELGLTEENLSEGDHADLLFDKDDNCTGVRTKEEENLAMSFMIAPLII